MEDDVDVSPHFWTWLQKASKTYGTNAEINGYGLSHPGMAHLTGDSLQVSNFALFHCSFI